MSSQDVDGLDRSDRGRLGNLRPDAIDTGKAKVANTTDLNAGLAAFQDARSPGSGTSTVASPVIPRVTVVNKLGTNREIALIAAPSTIGDFYDFGNILGRGGFGTVSEILHAKTFQPFAGKVLRKESFRDIKDGEALFRRVMEVLLNLENTNIVKMLHVFEDESNYYAVMGVCQGGTVRHMVKSVAGSLPVCIMEDVLQQTVSAVAFLHSLNMIHRDIKPDNVMLQTRVDFDHLVSGKARVQAMLVDFDMCCFLGEQGEVETEHLEGTQGYLAPEVLKTRRYTVRSDLFAFGCMTYFVLRQEDPCPKASMSSMQTHELAESVDEWLDEALTFCREATAQAEAAVRSEHSGSPGCSPGISEPTSPTSGKESPQWGLRGRGAAFPVGSDEASPTIRRQGDAESTPMLRSPASAGGVASGPTEPLYEGIPVRLWRLMAHCLKREAEQRPASAAEVLGKLCSVEDKAGKKDRPRRSSDKTSIRDLLTIKQPAAPVR